MLSITLEIVRIAKFAFFAGLLSISYALASFPLALFVLKFRTGYTPFLPPFISIIKYDPKKTY